MIVMMIASTPSLKASRRFFPMLISAADAESYLKRTLSWARRSVSPCRRRASRRVRRGARRSVRFGGLEKFNEEGREARGFEWIDSLR